MSDFYTVKTAADYLGVEYKTVWRLIRGGQLPAVRVGRVYRIHPQDLEAYLQAQRASASPQPTPEGEPILCGHCGRVLYEADLGGVCEHLACDEPLCSSCWEQGFHHCRAHRPTVQQRLAQVQAALAQGAIDRVVTSIQARQREQAFIARFEERIYDIAALQHPLTRELLKVKDWSLFHSAWDESERLLEIRGVAFLERSVLAVTPVNSASRFTIPPTRLGRSSPRQGLVLEVQCVSDLEAQAREGWVTGPTRLSTLLALLSERQEAAERDGYAWVVALAATSGWDDESVAHVAASPEGRSYRHRLLLPLLVDLHSSQLYYNIADERMKGIVELFKPTREAEELLRLRHWIEAKLDAEHRTGLTLQEVVDGSGLSAPFVQRVFQQMAQEPHYRFQPDSGGVLIRNPS